MLTLVLFNLSFLKSHGNLSASRFSSHNTEASGGTGKPININLVAVNLGYNRINGYQPVNFSTYPMLASLTLYEQELYVSIARRRHQTGCFLMKITYVGCRQRSISLAKHQFSTPLGTVGKGKG
ncbi:hypothetical protein L1887_29086 [Cichorium endivia]|nr:hypothetical protein L1887_29086 [Cichorium endivia]